jgi:hypothetical protein
VEDGSSAENERSEQEEHSSAQNGSSEQEEHSSAEDVSSAQNGREHSYAQNGSSEQEEHSSAEDVSSAQDGRSEQEEEPKDEKQLQVLDQPTVEVEHIFNLLEPAMKTERSDNGHETVRKLVVKYLAYVMRKKLERYMSVSAKAVEELCWGEKSLALLQQGKLEQYLHDIAQPGTWGDDFARLATQAYSETAIRVWTVANGRITTSSKESESLTVNLLLFEKHFYPLLPLASVHATKKFLSARPHVLIRTTCDQLFYAFGVAADGNCYFRSIAFFHRECHIHSSLAAPLEPCSCHCGT